MRFRDNLSDALHVVNYSISQDDLGWSDNVAKVRNVAMGSV